MSARNLTVDRLKELVKYDPNTGVFTWKIYRNSNAKNGDIVGKKYISADGYRVAMIDKSLHQQHRLAWLYFYGDWPLSAIDHINRDKTDNRISNLRLVSDAQNMQNRFKTRRNTSGYKGVHFVQSTKRWRAQLCVNGKRIDLGTYDTPDQAGMAYVLGVKKHCTHHPY